MPFEMSARGKRVMKMDTLARNFAARVPGYEQAAAESATQESKAVYERWKSHRPFAPARIGRPTTEGAFPSYLKWKRDGRGNVRFESGDLEAHAPYWLIQEIGTGQSARILNPPGEVTVRSQKGRRIPMSLMWADGPDSGYSRPVTGLGTQQLYESPHTVDEEGTRTLTDPRRAGRIRREIKGKHYLRDGGLLGYSTLREELLAQANRMFQ